MGKKIIVAGMVLAPLVAGAALAAPAPKPAQPARWPGCPGTAAVIRPSSYVLACGDGNARFQGLAWSSWGRWQARGTGQYLYSGCVPDCALGATHHKAVVVVLAAPRSVPPSGQYWTRLTIRFMGSKPARARWVEQLHWSRGFWRF